MQLLWLRALSKKIRRNRSRVAQTCATPPRGSGGRVVGLQGQARTPAFSAAATARKALHALPHLGLVHGRIMRLRAVLVEDGVVEGAVSRASSPGVRGGVEVSHGLGVPAHAGDAGAAHALHHAAPVAIFSSTSSRARVVSSQAGMKMSFSFRPWDSTSSRARARASVQSLPAFRS